MRRERASDLGLQLQVFLRECDNKLFCKFLCVQIAKLQSYKLNERLFVTGQDRNVMNEKIWTMFIAPHTIIIVKKQTIKDSFFKELLTFAFECCPIDRTGECSCPESILVIELACPEIILVTELACPEIILLTELACPEIILLTELACPEIILLTELACPERKKCF
jgi:hypothetical protein